MTDKELLKQLNSLKSIRMEAGVKESNKSILMTQISNTISNNSETKNFNSFLFYVRNILSMSSRPAMVLSGVFLFVVTSLFLGSDFYKNSKPTDSLYIARVISERARLNTTFDQNEREKLALEFASNHARDIATLLMDPEFNTEQNKDEVERLSASFKDEINKVKTKVADLQTSETENSEDQLVFSASELKEENGIDIYIDGNNFSENLDEATSTTSESDIEASASTTPEIENLGDQIEELSEKIDLESNQEIKKNKQVLIEEIESLFDEGKYGEVVLKLQEIK
ncbi:MAG TPA: hypothetical protein PK686_02745 [bacterium]|nr:hypothetical protein [bacterium]HPV65575.1 hypothetical protein [bacterium]